MREKIVDIITDYADFLDWDRIDGIADTIMEQCFATDNNVGNKRIEELETKLAEREEVICNLRKKWQAAETHICTMCGHFDHKTDGNIVYGNKTCGELVGYPCCGKFTPWIPVTERLPDVGRSVIAYNAPAKCAAEAVYKGEGKFLQFRWAARLQEQEVTHWMPLPEPPKGE
jgi:hypothetical protein